MVCILCRVRRCSSVFVGGVWRFARSYSLHTTRTMDAVDIHTATLEHMEASGRSKGNSR